MTSSLTIPNQQTNNLLSPRPLNSEASYYTSCSMSGRNTVFMGEEVCCGWLWMRSSKLRSWKYRYFSLRGCILTYYDKFPTEEYFKKEARGAHSFLHADGTHPKGVIRVAHVEKSGRNNLGFKVFGSNGKTIDCRSAKASIRATWMTALTNILSRRSRNWSDGNISIEEGSITSSNGNDSSSDYDSSPDFVQMPNCRATSVPIMKCGWMHKQSEYLKKWRKYFFILQGNMISYYITNKPYAVPRRRGYVTSVKKNTGTRGGLIISLNFGPPLHVTADTNSENNDWFDVLERCIDEYELEQDVTQEEQHDLPQESEVHFQKSAFEVLGSDVLSARNTDELFSDAENCLDADDSLFNSILSEEF